MAEVTESTPLDPAPQDRSRHTVDLETAPGALHHCKQLKGRKMSRLEHFEAAARSWQGYTTLLYEMALFAKSSAF